MKHYKRDSKIKVDETTEGKPIPKSNIYIFYPEKFIDFNGNCNWLWRLSWLLNLALVDVQLQFFPTQSKRKINVTIIQKVWSDFKIKDLAKEKKTISKHSDESPKTS